ncbi:MAG TPA: IS30 family transposase [Blastocatellia bacterium]|nr:IS30 family transposase [Blastocatellia bacterium]
MSYHQLTLDQRYQIYAFQKAGFSPSQIAQEIGVHKSTISRELRRNQGQRGYRPRQAHGLAQARRQSKQNATKIEPRTWRRIDSLLLKDFSPEQVRGYLKAQGEPSASHERISQHIYGDKQQGGSLYTHLRLRKRRRKRYGKYDRRGQIPNRKSISQRPEVVAKRERIGDWEADTRIGKNHSQAIVALVERKSLLTRLEKVTRKTDKAVKRATIRALKPLSDKVHTITSDNGKEFASHEAIAAQLGAALYFAHPYRSWERGTNENTNGLVRQYFPKGTDFSKITQREVKAVEKRLNSRPRKTLGYKTPNQVFFNSPPVALRC